MMKTYIVVNTMDTNLDQNPRFVIPVPPFLNPKTCGSASSSAVHTLRAVGTENNKRMLRQAGRSVYSASLLSTTSTNGDKCSNVNHSYTGSSLNRNLKSSASTSTTSPSFSSLCLTSSGSNEDENTNREKPTLAPLSYFGFTRRQWLILFNFALSNFFSSIVISLQGPFYPKEAEEKGATATEYGFVFGIFEFTMFVMCPICGALIGKISPRFMFIVGIFATGSCVILFGLLDYVDDRVTFITMSFVIRIAQACGDSAFVTASFTIIALEFPDSVATTFSWLETCFGLGLIVGPTLGGVLYEISGFFVTFLVVGCCLILLGVMTHFVLPKTEADENDSISDCSHEILISNIQLNQDKCVEDNTTEHRMQNKRGLLSLIAIPSVALASFSVVISCSSLGFLSATLEPHLRESFGLTPIYTGLIFIIDGGMYAISAPIWGKLCDKTKNLKIFTLIGAVLTFSGFLFVGPAPFIPISTTLWVTCLGLVLHGIGFGATLVSAFILAMRDAVAKGFGDNVNTYGLCSGLWTSCFSLGSFIGPSVGGVLLDSYGFQNGSLFVLSTQVIIVLTTLIYMFVSKRKPGYESHDVREKSTDLCNNNEAAPLLFNVKDKSISSSNKQQEHLPSKPGQNYQSNLSQNPILSSLNSKEGPYKQCYGSF